MSERRGDRVFTPDWCVQDMIAFFRPSGRILEPAKGDGAFTSRLPMADWCEIDEGRDFFRWSDPVDWIISNPPYSKTRLFMRHAFKLARNVCFLVPVRNIVSGYGTVREAVGFGGMVHIRWYGTGGKLGFPMGNAIAAIHWGRGYTGDTGQSFFEDGGNSGRFL